MDIVQLSMFDGKVCTKCVQWKLYVLFPKNKNTKDYVGVWCKECMKVYARNYVQKNREMFYQKKKEHYAKNSRRIKMQCHDHYHKNKERYQARQRAYQARNPDITKTGHVNRRARLRSAPGKIVIRQWRTLCNWFGNICVACSRSEKLTLDHVIPLVKGGSNDISNIQPLCLACNLSKSTKIIDYRDPDSLKEFLASMA